MTTDSHECPVCGEPYEERVVHYPREGPNKSEQSVELFFHEDADFCSRAVNSAATDGGRDLPPEADRINGRRVYASERATRFHVRRACAGYVGVEELTVSEARERGLDPCPLCGAEEAVKP